MSKILIVAQHSGGKLNAGTAKAVSCAQRVCSFGGGEIEIVVLAPEGAAVAAEAAKLAGVTRVLQVDHPANDHSLAAVLAPQIAELAKARGSSHVLRPAAPSART